MLDNKTDFAGGCLFANDSQSHYDPARDPSVSEVGGSHGRTESHTAGDAAELPSSSPAGANEHVRANEQVPVPPETISRIRLLYRKAKALEKTRIAGSHRLLAFVRVFLTDWTPGAERADRDTQSARARKIVKRIADGITLDELADDEDRLIYIDAIPQVEAMDTYARAVAAQEHRAVLEARRIVRTLPQWKRIAHVKGFGEWGLAALIGEAGDIGAYSGPRKLYKRLGLAPNECYPQGENGGGRMIPRNTRGRVMGIVADALLRAQWRGEKEGEPAHPIGPYGRVYGEAKVRRLAEGKTKMHAERLARWAMVKALIHDVHRAWHGMPLDFGAAGEPAID